MSGPSHPPDEELQPQNEEAQTATGDARGGLQTRMHRTTLPPNRGHSQIQQTGRRHPVPSNDVASRTVRLQRSPGHHLRIPGHHRDLLVGRGTKPRKWRNPVRGQALYSAQAKCPF
uniref:(northern house mosquito) hypothetical protein n=1 Tax=Culex pipiens TaxID=7175 RepID=A0A8D8E6P0_CULPI